MIGSDPYDLLIRQSSFLVGDLRGLAPDIWAKCGEVATERNWRCLRRIVTAGSGDSHFAAVAASLAFAQFSAIEYIPRSSLDCFYDAALVSGEGTQDTLFIGTSVSGRTKAAVGAIERAARSGACTLAVTAAPQGPLAHAAGAALVFQIAGLEKSPGIRTYQASLLCHLLIAIKVAEIRRKLSAGEAAALLDEILQVSELIDATSAAIQESCREVVPDLLRGGACMVLGSGPHLGTARYVAAKLVECAGLFAVAQDIEEWFHVERFADPVHSTVIILSGSGCTQERAEQVARYAHSLGWHVIRIGSEDRASGAPGRLIPVCCPSREAFTPLVLGLVGAPLGAEAARSLGRLPFQGDRPEIQEKIRPLREAVGDI